MRFINTKGRACNLTNASKYIIDWTSKSRSKFQRGIKQLLHKIWGADVVLEEMLVVGSRLSIDFYNASRQIAIEVDGNQHYKYNKFYHKGSKVNFLKQLQRDETKERFCELNDIYLVRIRDSDEILTVSGLEKFIDEYIEKYYE